MSYINKVESDYDKNILSLKEVSELREEYNSLSVTDKLELDLKSKIEVKEVKSKISEENKYLYRIERSVKTIKNILIYFATLSILSIIISIIILRTIKWKFSKSFN